MGHVNAIRTLARLNQCWSAKGGVAMCRYAGKSYKDHYACFSCRKVFRLSPFSGWVTPEVRFGLLVPTVKCAYCALPMTGMGHDFKAPRQSDIKQWRKVQQLWEAGITFYSCGCGPGYRPASLREVPSFIENHHRSASPGRRLAARFHHKRGS